MMMFLWPDDWRHIRTKWSLGTMASCRLLLQSISQSVLDPAHRVLNLAGSFFIPALDLKLGVTRGLADSFLHRAFDLLGRSLDAIFVHDL